MLSITMWVNYPALTQDLRCVGTRGQRDIPSLIINKM